MDSVGTLLHQINPSFKDQCNQLARELLEDPFITQFCEQYPQTMELDWAVNISKMYTYATESRNCAQCPGLHACPNDFPGHYTKLSLQDDSGQLMDKRTPCSKQLAYMEEYKIKQRIRSFYIDPAHLQEGYNEVEIMKRDRTRAPAVIHILRYIEQTKQQGLLSTGLFVSGAFGTGKTFLVSYLLHELAIQGYSGVIIYMPDFVEDLKSMIQENYKLKEMIEVLKQCDLLVFDDIGAENLNPWVRDHVLGAILNYRMNRKPTFYTSNYDLDGLEKHLSFTNKEGEDTNKGLRLMDRISPFVELVSVKGENQRTRKVDRSST